MATDFWLPCVGVSTGNIVLQTVYHYQHQMASLAIELRKRDEKYDEKDEIIFFPLLYSVTFESWFDNDDMGKLCNG